MDIDSDPFVHAQERIARNIFEHILHRPYVEPNSCLFGNWHWEIKLTEKEQKQAMGILRSEYNKGNIRYACVNSYYGV